MLRQLMPGGVAERSGLQKSDVILQVNDASFTGCTHAEAVERLQVGGGLRGKLFHSFNSHTIPPSPPPFTLCPS